MTTPAQPNACLLCTRLEWESIEEEWQGARCSSFPDGIPDAVWEGRDPHLDPYEDEEVFEAIDMDAAESLVLLFPTGGL